MPRSGPFRVVIKGGARMSWSSLSLGASTQCERKNDLDVGLALGSDAIAIVVRCVSLCVAMQSLSSFVVCNDAIALVDRDRRSVCSDAIAIVVRCV